MVDALCHVRIAAAAAGYNHTLALAEDGMAFSWGNNVEGQLGLGRIGGIEPLPQKIKVCSVAAEILTSCAVTAAGELFTWGCPGQQ